MNKIKIYTYSALLAASSPAFAATAFIDFGDNIGSATGLETDSNFWNSIGTGNATISNIVDITNGATTWDITTVSLNLDTGNVGTPGQYVANANGDMMGANNDNGQVIISDLDGSGNTAYSFTFYATYGGTSTVNTQYTVDGLGADSFVLLDAKANNPGNVGPDTIVGISNVIANLDGTITIDLDRNNSAVWTGLSVMTIVSSPIPEPSTATALLGLASLGLVFMRRRR